MKSETGVFKCGVYYMSKCFKSHELDLNTKVRQFRCYIFSILFDEVETGHLQKPHRNNLMLSKCISIEEY